MVPLAVATALFDDPGAAETAYRSRRSRWPRPRAPGAAPRNRCGQTPPGRPGRPRAARGRRAPASPPRSTRCPRLGATGRCADAVAAFMDRYVARGPMSRRRPARPSATGPALRSRPGPAPPVDRRPHRPWPTSPHVTDEQLRRAVACELAGRPRPHQRLLTDCVDEPRPDRAALAADVAAGLGPGAHRQPGGAVAAADGRRPRRRCGPRSTALRRLRAPARRRGPRCRCCRPPRPAATPHEVRGRVLDVAGRTPAAPGRPLLDGGLRLRHDRPARAAARRDDARHPPAARGGPPR